MEIIRRPPSIIRPPLPVVNGALERLRRQERERWRHIRDPRVERAYQMAASYQNSSGEYPTAGDATLTGVTAGNLLVLVLAGTTSLATTSVSGGGSWDSHLSEVAGGTQSFVRVFYCLSATGGDTTVTITNPPTNNGQLFHEFNWGGPPGSFDNQASVVTNVINPSTSAVPVATGAACMAYLFEALVDGDPVWGGSWVQRQDVVNMYGWSADQIFSAGGNLSVGITRAASNSYVLGFVSFAPNVASPIKLSRTVSTRPRAFAPGLAR